MLKLVIWGIHSIQSLGRKPNINAFPVFLSYRERIKSSRSTFLHNPLYCIAFRPQGARFCESFINSQWVIFSKTSTSIVRGLPYTSVLASVMKGTTLGSADKKN